jgi:hypothetical protein
MNGLNEFVGSAKKEKKIFDEDDVLFCYERMCLEYGFITERDFNSIKIPVFFLMLNQIATRQEKEQDEIDKMKHKGKR